jgi:biotin--protein ligase
MRKVGDGKIREFVNSGGNFVGFCAGSYWPARTVRCALVERHYMDYTYELQLFPGVAQGPLGWLPWKDGLTVNLDLATIDTSNPTMAAIGMPAKTRFLYGGGPWFEHTELIPGTCEVWARAVMPEGTPKEQSDGDNKPTIIRYQFGKGNVILFAYHPDVLINSMVDGLAEFENEKLIKWNWGNQTESEVNLNSWNIVHAALQIAAGQPVTRLTTLP